MFCVKFMRNLTQNMLNPEPKLATVGSSVNPVKLARLKPDL